MKSLPQEKPINTEGVIRNLEARVAELAEQVNRLRDELAKATRVAAAPTGQASIPQKTMQQGIVDSGFGIGIRGGIAKYIDVDRTLFVKDNTVGGIAYSSPLADTSSLKNNIVWDATAGCFKFYGVYKE